MNDIMELLMLEDLISGGSFMKKFVTEHKQKIDRLEAENAALTRQVGDLESEVNGLHNWQQSLEHDVQLANAAQLLLEQLQGDEQYIKGIIQKIYPPIQTDGKTVIELVHMMMDDLVMLKSQQEQIQYAEYDPQFGVSPLMEAYRVWRFGKAVQDRFGKGGNDEG